jgi:hypothetical protein
MGPWPPPVNRTVCRPDCGQRYHGPEAATGLRTPSTPASDIVHSRESSKNQDATLPQVPPRHHCPPRLHHPSSVTASAIRHYRTASATSTSTDTCPRSAPRHARDAPPPGGSPRTLPYTRDGRVARADGVILVFRPCRRTPVLRGWRG